MPDLVLFRAYYIEFRDAPAHEALLLLCDEIARTDSGGETEIDQLLLPSEVMVTRRRGVVDNENDSIIAMCEVLGMSAVAGKMATIYRSSSPRLPDLILAGQCNPMIEDFHQTEPKFESLRPQGAYDSPRRFDLRGLDEAGLATAGRDNDRNLTAAQVVHIRGIQEEPNLPYVTDVLLESLDARWSDHCAHTTWKSLGNLLQRLVNAARATRMSARRFSRMVCGRRANGSLIRRLLPPRDLGPAESAIRFGSQGRLVGTWLIDHGWFRLEPICERHRLLNLMADPHPGPRLPTRRTRRYA